MLFFIGSRRRLKSDGTRAETSFRLSAKRTSPFKSAGASVQSSNGTQGVRISGSNAGYTMFRGSVKSTGYLLQLPVSPSLPFPCVTVCHHISTGLCPLYRSLGEHQGRFGRVRTMSPRPGFDPRTIRPLVTTNNAILARKITTKR